MHLIISTIIILCKLTIYLLISIPITLANNEDFLNENEIKKNIKHITQENISNIDKEQIIEKLQLALHAISEIKYSKIKIQEYQNIINNFPSIIHQLYHNKNDKYHLQNYYDKNHHNIISSNDLRKFQIKINQQLVTLDQELQQTQNTARLINNSLILLPQQHTDTKKELNEINRKISSINTTKNTSYLDKAKLIALQAEKKAKQFKISELELAQLSANNRQEISRLHIESLKNKYNQLDKQSHMLHIQLHNIQEQETAQTIENIEILSNTTRNIIFPENIIQQIQINRHLSQSLKKQIQNINCVTLKQRKIDSEILQTRQIFSKLDEQAQWINKSTALGETLRAQISKLPKINYNPQQLDTKMVALRNKRLQYEEQINNLPTISSQNNKEYNNLTSNQKNILNIQINTQRKLLNSLLTNYDTQILELTKLKIAYEQLQDLRKDINKTIHQYLFWIADIQPITISYPYKIYQDLYLIISTENILYQIIQAIKITFLKNTKISIIFFTSFLFICFTYTKYHKHYYSFLSQSNKQLKTNYQRYFIFTLKNILWSSVIALPIPILWLIIGYILSQTWEYPIFHIIGTGIILSAPILWLFIIISYFSLKNGLFIMNFKWNKEKINKIKHHYYFRIIIIICTFIMLITFNDYNNKEFYSTMGRLCFIILCSCLTYTTYTFKQANLPLYLNKYGSPNNTINHALWNFMIIFPIVSASASYLGYFSLAQTLLMNLEISLIIFLISSIIYYTIQSWIIVQKNRILHKYKINNNKTHTKHFDTEKKLLSPIFHHDHHIYDNIINTYTTTQTIQKNIKNNIHINTLKIISNQSLQFIKHIIIFINIIIIIILWSEFHFIFKFLEQITLWDVTSSIQENHNIQPITLKTLLNTILIFFTTIKLIKNIPSLLEITILQHCNLTHGTNYAIITLTKYTIITLGITIGCSYIGFEWSKLQWLIAAIGVGLGFGLQEIFANFISGLIVLFEKPIRIGDTITICNFTGNITKINTRATSIIDRDHKEIIIPNKEFITKKFINWSLSDTITRVILKVPGPPNANITKIINILIEAITHCPLVLQTPKPEVYLIDIQQGIPLFEIRMHTSKISYRMPLKHQVHILILEFYKKNGLYIPFPNLQIHKH